MAASIDISFLSAQRQNEKDIKEIGAMIMTQYAYPLSQGAVT